MKHPFKLAILAIALLAPLSALAADGYVNGYVNLRAGPDTRYPRIMTLQPGTPVAVYGCLDNWSWCDVGSQGERGWIAGDYVRYPYGNQRVVLSTYGARIGIPIVSFMLGTYWGDHYQNRSWYGERQRWDHPDSGHGQPRPGYRPQQIYRPQRNYRMQPYNTPQDHGPQPPQLRGGADHGPGQASGGPGQRGGGPGHGGRQPPPGPNRGPDHGGHKPPPDSKGGGGGHGGGGG